MSPLIDDDRPPVEHRFLGLDRRKFLPALAVLALVIFWGGVVPGINEAVKADEIEAGTVYDMPLGLSFSPAAGWVLSGVPAPSAPTLSVYDDGIEFKISVGEFEGTPDELLDTINDLRDDFEFQGERQAIATASGIPGAAVELVQTKSDGALFAFVAVDPDADSNAPPSLGKATSVGIQVVVEGPPASLSDHAEDIGQMLASIQVEFSADGEEAGS